MIRLIIVLMAFACIMYVIQSHFENRFETTTKTNYNINGICSLTGAACEMQNGSHVCFCDECKFNTDKEG